MRIDSPVNPRIKAALRAVERGERLLLEGERAIGEALAAGIVPGEIFLEGKEKEGEGDPEAVREAARRGAKVYAVSSKVLRKLSDLPSARRVVALAVPPRRALGDLHLLRSPRSVPRSPSLNSSSSPSLTLSSSSVFVLLDGVQDPANVGAVVRSAEAFGAAAVLLTTGCASPFAPKAVRASALSALRVPIASDVAPEEAAAWAGREGVTLAGAATRGGAAPARLAAVRPLLLVIGSEGRGISPPLESRLALRVTIPLEGRVESLNAAVAAGVLLCLARRPPA